MCNTEIRPEGATVSVIIFTWTLSWKSDGYSTSSNSIKKTCHFWEEAKTQQVIEMLTCTLHPGHKICALQILETSSCPRNLFPSWYKESANRKRETQFIFIPKAENCQPTTSCRKRPRAIMLPEGEKRVKHLCSRLEVLEGLVFSAVWVSCVFPVGLPDGHWMLLPAFVFKGVQLLKSDTSGEHQCSSKPCCAVHRPEGLWALAL
jgi:hypothetical protein